MKKLYIQVLLIASLFAACNEIDEWWTEATDSIPPGKVTVIDTIRISGGVKIIIGRPSDPDLLGVKALYTMNKTHENLEAFISAFSDTIVLEGFGDTDTHEVTLIAVDKSLNESEGITTTIQALPNIIESIKATLTVADGFGGLYVTWENPTNQDIALSVSVYDETADLYDLAAPLVFRAEAKVAETVKGLAMNVEKKYRLEILDRWKNYSSPLDVVRSPLREDTIAVKNELGQYVVQRYQSNEQSSDNWKYRGEVNNYIGFVESIDGSWDNSLGWDFGSDPSIFNEGSNASRSSMPYPMYYILDMGRKASYSTYIFHQRKRSPLGSADFPVEFEIWGTNIPPKEPSTIGDGSMLANLQYWTPWVTIPGGSSGTDMVVNGRDTWKTDPAGGWTRLDSFSYRLPSGIRKGTGWPNPELSSEDQDYINAGIMYEFPIEMARVTARYLRFVILETSKDDRKATILEQEFRGAYVDD
ncbi:MAG: DUF4959 domain-containing protein [Prevotellaceae bacterium]|jgi:hypothetical protein|nr:DUF4959 domain-containing protein [Prevotellaceae bacterium]